MSGHIVRLCGGPKNGERVGVSRLQREYHFPLPPDRINVTTLGSAYMQYMQYVPLGPMRYLIYTARRVPSTGHLCIDAVTGDALYDWIGER